MKVVIAVDPGKKTGVAMFSLEHGDEPVLLEASEVDQRSMATELYRLIELSRRLGAHPEIVYERFVINAQTVRNSQAPYSLEQIGVIKHVCYDSGIPDSDIHIQSPADAKKMFSNETLKKLGYWFKGGEGHALDAIRHGLLRCVKIHWLPTRLFQ